MFLLYDLYILQTSYLQSRTCRYGKGMVIIMKKSILALCITMGICLAGCGQSEQSKKGTDKKAAQVAKENNSNASEQSSNENSASSPDYAVYEDAKSLVDASDSVFSGTVVGISHEDLKIYEGEGAEKFPYIIYEVKKDTLYDGEEVDDVLKIKQLDAGNENQENVTAGIEKGKKYLFIVETYEDSYPSLINVEQSVFEMDSDKSNDIQTYSLGTEKDDKKKISLEDVLSIVSK